MKQSLETVSEFKYLYESTGEKSDKIRGWLNYESVTIPNDDKITGVTDFAWCNRGHLFDVLRWQLYCVESLHCLGHPVTYAILRVSIKEAGAMLPFRY